MLCFNHGEFLSETVASVTKIGRDDVDLIVVDDDSTDEGTGREVVGCRPTTYCRFRSINLSVSPSSTDVSAIESEFGTEGALESRTFET